jgi:hypothetical protein
VERGGIPLAIKGRPMPCPNKRVFQDRHSQIGERSGDHLVIFICLAIEEEDEQAGSRVV